MLGDWNGRAVAAFSGNQGQTTVGEVIMRTIIAAALAAGVALVVVSPAEARQGCGPGYHLGPYGHCRLNQGNDRIVIAPGGLVVGNFYRGRGYWDGHRYFQHRMRDRNRNGWVYR